MTNDPFTPVPLSTPEGATSGPLTYRRRRGLGVIGGIAVAAVVAGVAVTGVGVAAASTSSDTDAARERGAISEQLREDLREVRAAEPTEQLALAEGILERALDGEYGERVTAIAEDVNARIEALPDQLEADLRALAEAPVEDRRELGQQIRERAESGGYGAEVQEQLDDLGNGFRPGQGSAFTANA